MSGTICKKVAVLIENEFDALQARRLLEIFKIADVEVTFVSHLWGYDSLLFTSDDPTYQILVSQEISTTNPADYHGIILIGGYAMDRLRYQANPICGAPNRAPGVEFLRLSVKAMTERKIKIGAIGHGLWLFCADPSLLWKRQVTCSHNILCDVANAGGVVMFDGDKAADIHEHHGLLTARDNSVVNEFTAKFAAAI